jgi:hypothetical protein
MTPINDETLANVAKWLGWRKVVDGYIAVDTDCHFVAREMSWLLSPDGEHAVRARLVENGCQITMSLNIEGCGYSIRSLVVGDCKWHGAESDTPAEALLLAVAQLAEGGR